MARYAPETSLEIVGRHMSELFSFIRDKKNRELLTWLGGGAVIIIGGLWAAFVYFNPPKSDKAATSVSADNCGIAIGGSPVNSPISSASNNCGNQQPKAK